MVCETKSEKDILTKWYELEKNIIPKLSTDEMERKYLAQAAFQITSEYDNSINNYFLDKTKKKDKLGARRKSESIIQTSQKLLLNNKKVQKIQKKK